MRNLNSIWKIYMRYYDAVLTRFPAYMTLHANVINLVKHILDDIQEENILIIDLGCGTGNLTGHLAALQEDYSSKMIRVIGIDNNDEALDLAKKKNGDCAEFHNFDLGNMKIDNLSEITGNNNEVKIAILINVFFSLPEKLKENAISAIKSLIGNDGIVIISEPHNPISLKDVIKKEGGLFKFVRAVLPVFLKLLVVLFINYRYLAKLVYPADIQHKLFTRHGFTRKNSIEKAYTGTNTIDVYRPESINTHKSEKSYKIRQIVKLNSKD